MSSPAHGDRYHSLDSLRGFAMFLGILLHAGMSLLMKQDFWPIRDRHPSILADVSVIAIHDFRMQLFFLLAGFFGCLLQRRYGNLGMLKHRVRRVAIPFVLALIFIVPSVQAIFLYAEIENVKGPELRGDFSKLTDYAAGLVAANPGATSEQLVGEFFISGAWLTNLSFVHLWFLYYLLIFYVAVGMLAPILGRLEGTALLARIDAGFRWVISGYGRVLVPALLTFPLMLSMRWIVDTQVGWWPRWHIVGYYFWFFAFGWMLFRHRDLVPAFGRRWSGNLLLANLLLLPAMIIVIVTGAEAEREGREWLGYQLAGFALSALYTWLMIAGLWGLFLRYFNGERKWVRYLADASYWCYLLSLTPIGIFQFWVKEWDIPAGVKFAIISLLTIPILLGSYEWGVRYTFIGAILNGRKQRIAK